MDLEGVKKEVAKQVELYLEKMVASGAADMLFIKLKEELEKAIPGKVDDMVLEILFPKLMPLLKEELLKVIEQISPEV